MAWLSKIWNTLRSRSLQNELDEELRLHLDLRTQELERSGMPHDEARAAAARQFGNATLQTERMRNMDIAAWLETVFNDLRSAVRQLVRNPAFSVMAVLSLALGIGANAAIFSVMNAMLFKGLPVHDPQELVSLTDPNDSYVWTGTDDHERFAISYPEFLQLRERLTTLSGLCAAQTFEPASVRIGRSSRVWVATLALTSPPSVLSSVATSVTVTLSVAEPTSSVASTRSVPATSTVRPVRTNFLKPATVTVSS